MQVIVTIIGIIIGLAGLFSVIGLGLAFFQNDDDKEDKIHIEILFKIEKDDKDQKD